MINKRSASCTVLLILLFSLDIFSCTTFVISGKATPDGKPLLFKNRDSGEMQNSLVYFTDGKYKYIGLVNGTDDWKTMVWGGYNEAGFAIMNSAAYNNNVDDTSDYKDQEGVISTQQGRGTFITSRLDEDQIQKLRMDKLRSMTGHMLQEALALGYDQQEIEAVFRTQLRKAASATR